MGVRPGTNFTVDDLDYIGRPRENRFDSWGIAEILNEHRERISIGQPMDGISELGHLHRQLLQEPTFHATGRVLLRKLDVEEENDKFILNLQSLPKGLRDALLGMEELGISTSTLRSTIRLVQDDMDALSWVEDNWEEFVDTNLDDALTNAEFHLSEAEDSEDLAIAARNIKTGIGFPRDSYQIVEIFKPNKFKEAAERRVANLKARLRDIQSCSTPEEVEVELERTRDSYQEDKAILEAWSPTRKREDRNLYLRMLHRQRRKQEQQETLKEDPLDFETIRRKVWACFDKESSEEITTQEVKALRPNWIESVNKKTKKILPSGLLTNKECESIIQKKGKDGKTLLLTTDPRKPIVQKEQTQSSIWEIEKSKAFCELNQTKKQWTKIYNYLWEKMQEVILWKLHTIRKEEEGLNLRKYLKRYRFRLDGDKLGKAVLDKATKAKTEAGKNFIRMILFNCQYQLSKETINQILTELRRS